MKPTSRKCGTNTNEYNSFSTEQSELDEVNHVWFHPTIKNKLYTDEINKPESDE